MTLLTPHFPSATPFEAAHGAVSILTCPQLYRCFIVVHMVLAAEEGRVLRLSELVSRTNTLHDRAGLVASPRSPQQRLRPSKARGCKRRSGR